MSECGAKTRSGGTCKRAAMRNGRCNLHGGKSLAALASPATKHGRYSKYLPARLLGRYQEALDDEALLHLHEEIALLDARLAELVERVDAAESGRAWAELAFAWQDVANSRGDAILFASAVAKLGHIIERGNTDYAAWQEVADLVERRRKLAESERKRHIEMQTSIRVDQAMLLVQSLVASVREHVTDRNILAALQADILRIIGPAAGTRDD